MHDIIRGMFVVVVDWYPLTTERGNVSLRHSDPTTAWREDGQGSIFVFFVSETFYPLLWWDHLSSYVEVKRRYLQIEKVLFGAFFYYMHHPLGWHIVPCLGILHDAWGMCRSLDSTSSPPGNISLQPPAPPPYPSYMCLYTCPWW